jgi:hypothetical protein
MSKYHLNFFKPHRVSTDGTPVMFESEIGLVTEVRSELNSVRLDVKSFICASLRKSPAELM